MASRDLKHNIKVVQGTAPAVLTAHATSAAIDTASHESVTLTIQTGAIVGSGNFTPKLQHSNTTESGDFVDVTDIDLIGEFPAVLAANTAYAVGYRGARRYVRSVLTLNSGTSIAAGTAVILGHARHAPTA